ncbi:MAG: ribonuclease III [Lachnospiraceae bacterium]|nr:ribonuclease III [Lachnospiraceae bacterium]HCM91988.1 ribonuclease III [Lachnospiraceae bacterium]
MDVSILENIKDKFGLADIDANGYSPLTLAFIGDSVFDLVVKTVVVERANRSANILHRKTSRIVRAQSQAQMVKWFIEKGILSDEELAIYKRGRNAKSPTTAKNASVGDYRKATGLEALIGYLYLKNRTSRIVELIKTGMELTDE